jgi:WD40 repeat protein
VQRGRADQAASTAEYRLLAAQIVDLPVSNPYRAEAAVVLARHSTLPEVRSALYTVAYGYPARLRALHTGSHNLAATADRRLFAASTPDGVELRDTTTLAATTAPFPAPIDALALPLANGSGILTATRQPPHTLTRWNVDTRTATASKTLADTGAGTLSVSVGDREQLVAAASDGVLVVLDAQSLERVRDPVRLGTGTLAVAASPTTDLVAVGWNDGATTVKIALVAARTGAVTAELAPISVTSADPPVLTFSPDGTQLLVVPGADTPDQLVDVATMPATSRPLPATGGAVGFSADSSRAVFGLADATVVTVDVATAQRIGEPVRIGEPIHSLVVGADGHTAIAEGGDLVQIALDDQATGPGELIPETTGDWFAYLFPDGQRLLVSRDAAKPGHVLSRIIDLTGQELKSNEGAFGVSPRYGYELRGTADGAVEVREPDGRVRWRRVVDPGNSAIFTGEFDTAKYSRIVVVTQTRHVLVLDPIDGHTIAELPSLPTDGPDRAVQVAATEAGLLAIASPRTGTDGGITGQVDFFDLRTGTPNGRPLVGLPPPGGLAFAGNRNLLVGDSDGGITRFDVGSRRREQTVPAHTQEVVSLSTSDNGALVVSVGRDATARLWDTRTLKPLGQPIPLPRPYTIAQPSHDGTKLVVPTAAGIRIVDLDPDVISARLCMDRLGNIPRDQWSTIFGDTIPFEPACPDLPIPETPPQGAPR